MSSAAAETRRRRADLLRDVALLLLAKLALGALVYAGGFRAVSDDDYARVVLMQQWAEAPRLDPTGSSWLPFPFWLSGGAMLMAGSSLWVARAVAMLSGAAATVLLYLAARTLVGRREALAGALLAAWLPWSAYLGVSTVPELLTAALGVFALSTVALPGGPKSQRRIGSKDRQRARAEGRRRVGAEERATSPLWGGVALLVACLSRYEAWVIAGCFVLLLVWSGWRASRHAGKASGERDEGEASNEGEVGGEGEASGEGDAGEASGEREAKGVGDEAAGAGIAIGGNGVGGEASGAGVAGRSRWLAALLALAGPALWLLHNAVAHGSALRFAERVSAYRRALHGAPPAWHAWLDHLLLLVRQEPELWLMAAVAIAGYRWLAKLWPRSLPRMALACGVLLVALSWAAGRGGTATHHAGRSLLLVWLVAAIYVGAAVRSLLRSQLRVYVALAIAGILVLGMGVLRPWYGRFEHFSRREPLADFGAQAAEQLHRISSGQRRDVSRSADSERALPGSVPAAASGSAVSGSAVSGSRGGASRVLLDASDYGYFAIQAGSGRPSLWSLDRDLDPRTQQPQSSFRSCAALQATLDRLRDKQPLTHAASHRSEVAAWLGPHLASHAGWSLYPLPAKLRCAEP